MILTSKGRYAVDSIDEMAKLSSGKRVPLSLIASNQEKSFSYLERIFSQLRRVKIIIFFKGPGGGYIFLKDTKNISVYNIGSRRVNKNDKLY